MTDQTASLSDRLIAAARELEELGNDPENLRDSTSSLLREAAAATAPSFHANVRGLLQEAAAATAKQIVSSPKPGDEARGRLQNMGVAEPSAALVVAEMVHESADVAARTAWANSQVLGFAAPALAHFDAAVGEARRVRDALLCAED